jgi:hypothetical protein
MPREEMRKERNTTLDTLTRHGWWKKEAIRGAQKKSRAYMMTDITTLKEKTLL